MTRSLLTILITLFWVTPAGAGEIILDDDVDRQVVHSSIEMLEDEKGVLTLEDVTRGDASKAFRDAGEIYFSLGFSKSVYWYRFTVNNPAEQSRERILLVNNGMLDDVELYLPHPSGTHRRIRMGDRLPYDDRTVKHHHFLNKLIIPPGTTTYLLRIKTEDPLFTPMTLQATTYFDKTEWKMGFYFGVLYGALLLLFLYNGIIFLSIRDPRYFFYCLYLSAFFLMNISYNGFAYQYLWPDSSQWANYSYGLFINLFQVTGLLFAFSFLNPRKYMPRINSVMKGFLVFLLVSLPLTYLIGDRVFFNMIPIYAIFIYSPLIALAGVVALIKGFRAARFFVIASFATLIGALISALTVSGFLPYTFANIHAIEFGLFADMVLLSLALADRINQMRAEREDVQQQARETLSRAKDNLELTISQRTSELQAAKEAAEQLARVDVLTGASNRRSFDELARLEFTRFRRHENDLAVIVFDLDLFKKINDTYGHQAGDEVISHVARLAMDAVREVDTVGRMGGEEFAILLPETDALQAAEIAERLREQIMRSIINDGGREISYTASFGIAQVDAGDASTEPALRRADTAMYASKKLGRNRVTIWSEDLAVTSV